MVVNLCRKVTTMVCRFVIHPASNQNFSAAYGQRGILRDKVLALSDMAKPLSEQQPLRIIICF